jgi:DNA-binding CsgD family transcriptional regulator
MDEGWRLLEESIARAVTGRFEGSAARAYRMLGSSASVLVEYPRAVRWLREGIGYAERAERFNDLHYMTAHLGHVLWATGDWAGARAEAMRALADGRGGITTRITALYVLGYVGLGNALGSVASAPRPGQVLGLAASAPRPGEVLASAAFARQSGEALAEAAALGEGMHELQRVSPAWWGLAEAALLSGDHGSALDWCERGYEASARVRDAGYLFPFVVTGTRAFLGRHDLTGARAWLARTSELLVERRIPGTLGAVDHAWGLIHLHDGQTGKARVALAKAAAFWSSRQRFWEGTAVLVDQARCATRSRRPAEAAVFAAGARAAYASVGFDLPDLAPAPPGRESPGGPLSARELEVARLVATGSTNREIATALTIAPKTVAAHVEHILAKLDVSRRAQIATWIATEVEHSS